MLLSDAEKIALVDSIFNNTVTNEYIISKFQEKIAEIIDDGITEPVKIYSLNNEDVKINILETSSEIYINSNKIIGIKSIVNKLLESGTIIVRDKTAKKNRKQFHLRFFRKYIKLSYDYEFPISKN